MHNPALTNVVQAVCSHRTLRFATQQTGSSRISENGSDGNRANAEARGEHETKE